MSTSRANAAPKIITGHYALLFPTNYVKACDLHGRDVTVAIDHLEHEVLQMQGAKKEEKVVLHLRAVRKDGTVGDLLGKRLVMNKTNAKLVAAVVGDTDTARWSGAKITLYPTKCRGADGSQVECVRVRARVNAGATEMPGDMSAAPEPQPPEPGSDG